MNFRYKLEPVYGSSPPKVRVYLISAVSCIFGPSYNVVDVYVEILITSINSGLTGILRTKFHKKTDTCYFWRKIIKLSKKGLGMSQTQLTRVLWLMEGKINQFFFKISVSSKNQKIWMSLYVFCICGNWLYDICI